MIEFYSLGSSSRGNAFLVRTGPDHWLIDAGLSATEITSRLKDRHLMPGDLSGIWITHEHGDHIRGLCGIQRRAAIPIFISSRCHAVAGIHLSPDLVVPIHAGQEVVLGNTRVRVRGKSHDAVDPLFFTFTYGGRAVSIITDLGYACADVRTAVADSDGLILEANHETAMLLSGPYPAFLKRRVGGDRGHLSNHQAAELLVRAATPRLRHILLAHVSQKNNSAATALAVISRALSPWPDSRPPEVSAAPQCGGTEPIKL
ncbi:MAG TPA: MBL fold metallo-hydrolase [Candidatus Aminicenantes bacterium]|nr:MBL fold metallo-hydrolase [Candidatus Aminicenantes bacterium]